MTTLKNIAWVIVGICLLYVAVHALKIVTWATTLPVDIVIKIASDIAIIIIAYAGLRACWRKIRGILS